MKKKIAILLIKIACLLTHDDLVVNVGEKAVE